MSRSPSTATAVTLGVVGLLAGLGFALTSHTYLGDQKTALKQERMAAMDRAQAATSRMAELELKIREVEYAPVPVSLGDALPDSLDARLGRPALHEEVAMWDIDIRPDGTGLPAGRGDVWTGEEVFAANCAGCHGDFGEAVGRWPVLAGGIDTLTDDRPVKTIGSYWPYLSTVYDYINRAMPFGYSQSLTPDEVYAITAYLLYLNDLVEDDFELSHENFTDIALPNVDNFYFDDRAEVEYTIFSAEPCMQNCKDSVEVTARARMIDVTPDENDEDARASDAPDTQDMQVAQHSGVSASHGSVTQVSDTQAPQTDAAVAALLAIEGDIEYGAYLSSECTACHLSSAETSEIPSIVNWPASDFAIALHAYRVKEREHPVMEMVAARLGDEEIAALAAYFETIER